MKTREFWIEFGGDPSDDKEVYKRYCATVPFKPSCLNCEVIHVRECVPIDWKKIKSEYFKWGGALTGDEMAIDLIQQLVEKQLRGEE